jgi:hypothetical protein
MSIDLAIKFMNMANQSPTESSVACLEFLSIKTRLKANRSCILWIGDS